MRTRIHLTLPKWWQDAMQQLPTHIESLEERMATVIRFSRLNFEQGTGGPFAAGVFERDTGRIVTIGINRVVPMNCSSAHAEVVALSLAQKELDTFDLGGANMPAHQLVVNWRPCAMCYGATIWSGVRSLVIAGSDRAVEDLTGFDEGPLPADWKGELHKRGIDVIDNLLREQACDVFRDFGRSDALVYNGRLGDKERPFSEKGRS